LRPSCRPPTQLCEEAEGVVGKKARGGKGGAYKRENGKERKRGRARARGAFRGQRATRQTDGCRREVGNGLGGSARKRAAAQGLGRQRCGAHSGCAAVFFCLFLVQKGATKTRARLVRAKRGGVWGGGQKAVFVMGKDPRKGKGEGTHVYVLRRVFFWGEKEEGKSPQGRTRSPLSHTRSAARAQACN
jgi:hypothetical protein